MVRLEPWRAALAALREGRRAVIVTVANNSAHSPGTRGATLAVLSDRVFGTIGGGIMEERTIREARAMLTQAASAPRRERLEHRERAQSPSGLICAGEQTNIWLSLSPTDADAIALGLEQGEFYVTGRGLFAAEQPGEWCERVELVAEDRVLIVGAGHCGQALARQMRLLGWDVALVDPRPAVSTIVSDEGAVRIASYSLVHEYVVDRTAAIVMTHSFETDVEALQSLLTSKATRPALIGLMGSSAKKQRIAKRLADVGLSLDSVHCPVGLEMRSETPEEIAVSVAAQLLRWAD